MKLAILSDFHFGYSRFYEDSFSQSAEAMRKACELADVILVPGDIFDSRSPALDVIKKAIEVFSIPHKKEWKARVEGRKGMAPVIVINGDHERRSREFTNAIHILDASGVAVDAHNEPVVLELGGEKVVVHGLGNVPDYLAKAAIEKKNYRPVKGAFNVFMFHQSLKELLPVDEAMSVEDLPDGFDLYVCGHMHRNIVRPVGKAKLVIPGSTVLTQMKKDEQEGKGIYVYDTANGKAEFVPIKTRPFFYCEIKLKSASLAEAQKACEQELRGVLARCKEEMPVVRMKLVGTLAKGLSSENLVIGLDEELAKKAHVTVVKELKGSEGEKVALIRDLREQKVSVKELGMKMLLKRLAEKGAKVKDVEGLFELLAVPKGTEKAFGKLKESSS